MNIGRTETLIAGFVAFIAWGLAVQWLPVLRLLGYAFNLGLLTSLAGVCIAVIGTTRPPIRHPAPRPTIVPAFVSHALWEKESTQYLEAQKHEAIQLYPESFVVSQALDGLVTLALRDFVSSWYTHISKSSAFVSEVERNIKQALVSIKCRLLDEDLADIVVSRIIPIITAHLRDFDQAEKAVRGKALNKNVTESEELDLAIAAKYRNGSLHPAASTLYSDTKAIQQDHIRNILVRILPKILPENMVKSRAVAVLVKEIISCAVLSPIVELLADPDTWNQVFELYGRTTLEDRKTVRRMRAALDEHTSSAHKRQLSADLPRLGPNDSERAFERFVRAIRRTKNLSEARRFRSQISSQLAKESAVEGQDPVYIRRLEMAKRVLDQKIARMSNKSVTSVQQSVQPDVRTGRVSKPREWRLIQIMHTASGLSYFMEFMDRQKRMSLVQFWIVVDGFRNPLEDDFGEEAPAGSTTSWSDTDRMDIAQINEMYISKPELEIPTESQEAIREFLVSGRNGTPEQYRAARTAILAAQSAVLEVLESRYFPPFRKSDLYYKFLASDEASAKNLEVDTIFDGSGSEILQRPQHASPMIRSSSQPAVKQKNLRRAADTSADLPSLLSSKVSNSSSTTAPKRSVDANERAPLFDDGYDTDPLAHSSYSIGHEPANGDLVQDKQMIESMEAALTNIMTQSPMNEEASEDERDALFGEFSSDLRSPTKRSFSPIAASSSENMDSGSRKNSFPADKPKPSLATLGLVNTSSRIGVFTDNDLFGDEEQFSEDEYADRAPNAAEISLEDEIHQAAPGDLGLTEAITVLTNDIERLVAQDAVVDTLTRKAELTNNVSELRILGKSKASLQREIRRKELQRQQYIIQESDNSLYGRSNIRIKSVMVGKDEDEREFALYLIEVQRQAGDQMPAATWAIARRYSEFHDLHQRLRRRYPSTRNLEFPRRRMVMKLQKQFLHNRRVALENYLQQLLRMPDVCRSRELRSFLSQQAVLPAPAKQNLNSSDVAASNTQDIVTRIYNSVTDGMDDFLGNIAVLDQLSIAGQNLMSAATGQIMYASSQPNLNNGNVNSNEIVSIIEPGSIAEAEAELGAFEDNSNNKQRTAIQQQPFVKPICDIFLETFELNKGNNWLRGRAVVVVLHQLLGGTVERKIRDTFKSLFAEDALLKYIEMVRNAMWPVPPATAPDGMTPAAEKATSAAPTPPTQPRIPRTPLQKSKTRDEARFMLSTLLPDLAGSVVGRTNAQAAARRISAMINNRRLNLHLVMTILDEIVAVLFDDDRITTTATSGSRGTGS